MRKKQKISGLSLVCAKAELFCARQRVVTFNDCEIDTAEFEIVAVEISNVERDADGVRVSVKLRRSAAQIYKI